MLKYINICNVKFGDCFILKNNSDIESSAKMLVDFGSIQKIRKPIIDIVNNELKTDNNKYLMVTHFHSDHYSGIKKLDKSIIFDEIYLPNYFSKDIVLLQFTLLSILSESHPAYQIAYNLLSVIPDLFRHINNRTKIIFVKRGEHIYNNIDSFRILWPNVNCFDIQAKELYNEVVRYYSIDEEQQHYLKHLTNAYFSVLPELKEREGNNYVMQFTDLKFSIEKIQLIQNDIKKVSKGNIKPKKRLWYKLSQKISSYQNRICICFDNKNEGNTYENKSVLFLSDISREYLYEIIASTDDLKLLNRYYAIKVAHHGTKDYFVENLPSCDYMIISNGYAKNSSWQITALYGGHYKERSFICADYLNACDYTLTKHKCDAYKSATCICGFKNNYELCL